LKGKERSDMMKEIFHLQRFDLASKVGMLQYYQNSIGSIKGALSGFEAISKETICFRNRGCRRRYGIKKKTELVLAETELKQLH
jgi:exonuclease SbcC